jgi:hypothetical protein
MNRNIRRQLITGLLAATIGTAALAGPAAAGGSVSLSIVPTQPQDARALQAGMQLYSLYKGIKSGGSIKQIGRDNAAGIGQNGAGNQGIIHQKGTGHAASLQQNGHGNSYGIFQFGRNTSAHVAQNGNGQAGATFQFGW